MKIVVWAASALIVLSFPVSVRCVSAEEVAPQDEYMKRLKVHQTIQPLGETPFGESINLYTGELSFRQTDVSLEGTGPTIVLARETTTAQTRELRLLPGAFHDWVLSVPRIETLMPMASTRPPTGGAAVSTPGQYWKVSAFANDTTGTDARCSHFGVPRYTSPIHIDDWWQGYELITEDGGRQQLLKRTAENPGKPAMVDGGGQPLAFPAVTAQHWQLTCLPTTSNGQAGEAFLAIAPNGNKYYFDYLVGERASAIARESGMGTTNYYQQRMWATMYVSRIEDRFGNRVDYQYTGDRLTSITGSDGRAVSILWRSDARVIDQIIVQPADAQPQVWRYEYSNATTAGRIRYWLSAVVQPDNARWSFSLANLDTNAGLPGFSDCGVRTNPQNHLISATSTVTHPSGLVGTFGLGPAWHARSHVPSACIQDSADSPFYEAIPPLYGTYSLLQKQFSGPGLVTATWLYRYSDPQGSTTEDACVGSNSCAAAASVTVTAPDGNIHRYVHGTRWGALEGKLLSTETYQGSTTLLRTETVDYAGSAAGPYPSRIGDSMQGWRSNVAKSETWTPARQTRIVQDSRVFSRDVQEFDTQARPVRVQRSSSPTP